MPKKQTLTKKTPKVVEKVPKIEKKSQTLPKNDVKVVKKPLGICIPYYKNTEECELYFKQLMQKVQNQIANNDFTYVLIVEDGQNSKWLDEFESDKVHIHRNDKNKGVSYSRNYGLDYFKDRANYICFLDSDDDIADDFVTTVANYARDNTHEILETQVCCNGCMSDFQHEGHHRAAVWGYAFRMDAVGKNRFPEDLQYTEDAEFTANVIDFTKYRKINLPTVYYYYYARNPESLSVKFNKTKNKYR